MTTANYNYVLVMLRSRNFNPNHHDIEDIVSDATVSALENGVDPTSKPFKGYLVIQTLRYMDKARKRKTEPISAARNICDSPRQPDSEDMTSVIGAMAILQPYLADTAQHMARGLTPTFSANSLGIKPRTVSVNRCRALDAIRATLRGD